MERALEASPDDPEILTDLGVACFKKTNLQEAIRHLEKARSLDPTYGKPYPYLGMIYEKQDDFQKAIRQYSIYCEKYPLTSTGRHLKARIGVLMRKQIAREIQAAIQQEKSMPVESIPENTIAVSYFSNLTGDEEWDLLRDDQELAYPEIRIFFAPSAPFSSVTKVTVTVFTGYGGTKTTSEMDMDADARRAAA